MAELGWKWFSGTKISSMYCFFNIAMHSTYWLSLCHTLLLVSKPDPFCFLPLIAFSIRKQSALRNRKGLACEIELLQWPFVHYFSTLHQPPLHLPSPSHTLLQEQWVTRSSLNAETLKMLTYPFGRLVRSSTYGCPFKRLLWYGKCGVH